MGPLGVGPPGVGDESVPVITGSVGVGDNVLNMGNVGVGDPFGSVTTGISGPVIILQGSVGVGMVVGVTPRKLGGVGVSALKPGGVGVGELTVKVTSGNVGPETTTDGDATGGVTAGPHPFLPSAVCAYLLHTLAVFASYSI